MAETGVYKRELWCMIFIPTWYSAQPHLLKKCDLSLAFFVKFKHSTSAVDNKHTSSASPHSFYEKLHTFLNR